MKKSMKKFMIACAAVSAMAVAAGMSAMAADITDSYDAGDKAIPVATPADAADGQTTVLVIPTKAKANVTKDDILYINQAAKGELPSPALLIDKDTPLENGTYSVLVGYYTAEGGFAIAEDTFTIGGGSEETREILMGDVTVDGVVNSTDAQQILRYAVKGTAGFASNPDAVIAADVTADETINSTDAQQTLRFSVKGTSGSKAGQTAVVNADGTIVEYK